ncbi:hypothetical protein GMORB2_6542 [Geosmithia morbida]|uniref:Metallothionein n=1 Tax=Geosmithia morbida TaxID=1094350 RepID=A0A9P4YWD4_9HYPO|nr:uncharacterized protein GMORB2_6542 [Geosmithia morbida]KAF4122994.1 hypothetical protein GMORB2_6542 [Geosmithia morbida]
MAVAYCCLALPSSQVVIDLGPSTYTCATCNCAGSCDACKCDSCGH